MIYILHLYNIIGTSEMMQATYNFMKKYTPMIAENIRRRK